MVLWLLSDDNIHVSIIREEGTVDVFATRRWSEDTDSSDEESGDRDSDESDTDEDLF